MPSSSICVAGLFEDAVSTSPSGDHITTIVLRLSAIPDQEWVEAFHHEWALTSYPRKRNARFGSVQVPSGPPRTGIAFSSSPQDYVAIHRRHVEGAVERANDRVRQRDRQRDRTIAQAAEAIREINRAHYGDADSGLRLAV